MNYGHFFKLDNYSNISLGQVAFRYLPVRKKSAIGEKIQDVFYPIYLVFNKHSVDFYFHQGEEESDEQDKGLHTHVRILHLPLSQNLNIKDALTTILRKNIFDEYYELGDNYEVNYNKETLAYWNLQVFNPKDYEKNKQKISFRKMVLDFLFDLEHSSVFENCNLIEDVEIKLKENFMFNAIATKASYYWLRTMYYKNKFDRKAVKIYGNNLISAESQWLSIIQDSLSLTLFPNSGGWFKKSVESEAKEVLFPKQKFDRYRWRNNRLIKDEKNQDDEIQVLRKTAQWFTRRYNLYNAIKTITQYNKKFLPIIIFIFIILNLFFINVLQPTTDTVENLIIFICISFLSFLILLFLFYHKLTLPLLGLLMPRLIMAISSAWLFFITSEEFWNASFDVDITVNYSVFLLLVPVILFMGIEIYNIAPDIKTFRLIKRGVGILIIGMIYSILIGTLFINFTGKKIFERSDYLKTFYREQLLADWGNNLIIPNPYKLIAKMCDKSKFGNFKDFKDEVVLEENLKEMQYNLIDSVEFNKINKAYKTNTIKEKIIIYNIYKNFLKNENELSYEKFYKAVIDNELFNRANLFYGLKYIKFKSCKLYLLQEIDIGLPFLQKILIFPGMLFYRAIYTLFIGIFIQLIFEEKPITEPL